MEQQLQQLIRWHIRQAVTLIGSHDTDTHTGYFGPK